MYRVFYGLEAKLTLAFEAMKYGIAKRSRYLIPSMRAQAVALIPLWEPKKNWASCTWRLAKTRWARLARFHMGRLNVFHTQRVCKRYAKLGIPNNRLMEENKSLQLN